MIIQDYGCGPFIQGVRVIIRDTQSTDGREGDHMAVQAEIRGMWPQPKECLGHWKLEGARKDPSPRVPGGSTLTLSI